MANPKHLEILRNGVEEWNQWREQHPHDKPDLTGADLSPLPMLRGLNLRDANLHNAKLLGGNLQDADLGGANLRGAWFPVAHLDGADLDKSFLSRAFLGQATLKKASLRGANLRRANLNGADLRAANLRDANLSKVNLERANLTETNLAGAKLHGCWVYGISAWDVRVDEATTQHDLVITPKDQDTITVDDLEIAHFIYTLLNNKKVRFVIDTITSKLVLILGRFTEERKHVLDAIRNELRKRDYLPVLFDFDKPESRDLTETISTLAHMARFIIADITDARAVPHELQKVVPNLPSLPVRPIILDGQYEYGMFKDLAGYLSVLPPYRYQDTQHLLAALEEEIIGPALTKAEEIAERRKAFEAELGRHQ